MIDPNKIFEIKQYFDLPDNYLDEDLINWLYLQTENGNIKIKNKKNENNG